MTLTRWMIVLSVASCLALIGVSGGAFVTEFVAAMAGPLVAVLASWAWISRTSVRGLGIISSSRRISVKKSRPKTGFH